MTSYPIDYSQIRQWWDVFHKDDSIAKRPVEIRIIDKRDKKPQSGYFLSVETLMERISHTAGTNIYSCINPIKDSCSGRSQRDTIMSNVVATTSDNDIEGRSWILIDIDPVRPTDTNATDAEKGFARSVMLAIGAFLRDEGFSAPVITDSGNGYHLYYAVHLGNSEENKVLLETFLKTIDMLFSTGKADVDTSVFNAGRISKVPGTWSAKGSNTQDRPYRICRFVKVPDKVNTTDISFIKKVCSYMPVKETPNRFNGYRTESFDIDSFIRKHGIEVAKEASFKGNGRKLILAHCPFDENHKAPDSAIFVMPDGAIGFKCLHNSCSQYTWRDVRLKFEPDAYERRYREEYSQKRDYYAEKPKPEIAKESEDKGRKWLQMSEIDRVDITKFPHIPTGFSEFDKTYCGLMLGDVTVISGLAGGGKSSLINIIVLNAIQSGYKVAVWSGELQPFRYQSWIDQAAAGRNIVRQVPNYDDLFYCPKDAAEKINKWLDGKLYLYNNEYGDKWSQLSSDIKEVVAQNGTQLVVLDNLSAMDVDKFEGDKNEVQSRYIKEVKNFAKSANIHIIQVIHPKKEFNGRLLRMESIAGSRDLYGLVDNVLICHRVGMDFVKSATEFYGSRETEKLQGYDEVVEITKNRSIGKLIRIGLYFELESRRFKNSQDEYIVYGWNETPQTLTLDMYEAAMPQEPDDSALRQYNGYANENDDDCPF